MQSWAANLFRQSASEPETRGDSLRSSSILFDASAFVRVSSTVSPVSCASVLRYDRCAEVIGSSPVFQSSGSFFAVEDGSELGFVMREEKANSTPVLVPLALPDIDVETAQTL